MEGRFLTTESLLSQVTRPARYAGGEWNSTVKDWRGGGVRVALVYPDSYEIGMSNMALPILYTLINRREEDLAERVFAPWLDMEDALRKSGAPLFSLETRHPLGEFDIIGFSLGYELIYTNVLNMLDLAQLPVRSAERDESHPLVIAGGTCAFNPEPMSDFIDLFIIGDGEEVVPEFLELFRAWKKDNAGGKGSRQELLRQAAKLEGIYVPSLYREERFEDGSFKALEPLTHEAGRRVRRRLVATLPAPVVAPVVPYIETVHDRGAVEIQRGCARGCRFCQAGIVYRPVRERPQGEVVEAVEGLLRHCGYPEVSLVSLSTSDYPDIESLVRTLCERYREEILSISLPSLRIDNFSLALMDALPSRRKTTLTFAPEAGTDRLRQVINKDIPEDKILDTAEAAFEKGWKNLKLYFMVGLPTEKAEDIEGIVSLVGKIRQRCRKAGARQMQVKASISPLVPKPQTPFQWVAQEAEEQLLSKQERIRSGVQRLGAQFSWQNIKMSHLEAALSLGDRRVGQAIYRAWQSGCRFDAWSECFNYTKWQGAFAASGLDIASYANRGRSLESALPWEHIDVGVTQAFLKKEYLRAVEGVTTPECRHGQCSACGLQGRVPACRQKCQDSASQGSSGS